MDTNYIALNVPNTITIVIMATVGILVLGLISAALQSYMAGGDV